MNVLRQLDARIPLTALIIAGLCAVFWLDSRYPSLQGKAGSDPREALATPLGFEKHWPEPPADQTLQHIGWTAAEWAVTNKQGMTFGVLLAAGLLTLVPLLPQPRGGRFAGSLQGLLIGAPLGVCVNCAAPIGQAMLRGGSRVEVALATMFTSPSFNVIVLGMLFTLFPWYLVAIKVGSVLLIVLVLVPVLSRLAERPGWRHPARAAPPALPGLRAFQWLERAFAAASTALLAPAGDRPKSFWHALAWVAVRYPKNLWTVIRLSVPLMLLAGVIGAVLVELLPWHELTRLARVEGALKNAALLATVAAFGVLLPVPIAFDIVLCSVLWTAGLPPYLVAALLVTLGIYSVYPWSLIGVSLSWRIASIAGAAIFALGVAAGALADGLDRWHDLRLSREAESVLRAPAPAASLPALPAGRAAVDLRDAAPRLTAPAQLARIENAELWHAPFRVATSAAGATAFARIVGPAVGLERLPLRRAYLSMQPGVMELGGLAAGDVNGDGWPDLAVGTPFGVWLYANLGGQFALQAIDLPAQREWIIGDVALVDLDGDGALDLFFSTWMNGSHVLFNRNGSFGASAHAVLPRGNETAVHAAAFADVDRDGDLDIATGASTFQMWNFYPATAVNKLWRNDGRGGFSAETLEGPEGETLALLFHDFDADGWPDLFVGNDFDEPDRYYRNERGALRAQPASGSPVPYSTTTTMSLDTGDIDNDGAPELYFGQIALGNPGGDLARKLAPPVASCAINGDVADRARCDALARFQAAVTRARDTESLAPCDALADAAERRDCVVTAYLWNRVLVKLPALRASRERVLEECARIPADYAGMLAVCETIGASSMDYGLSHQDHPGLLPSRSRYNLLWSPREGALRDVTREWGAGFGGWSWNAKFADFDNDGWQDLFVAQGTRLRLNNAYSLLYRNEGGKTFSDQTRALGLEDHRPTGAALQLDVDLDGDLDLVTYPFLLTPTLWRNDAPRGGGFEVALRDERGSNREAIGARVELRGPGGALQVRDIKGSGGYQSHDVAVAHFGLGRWSAASALRVTWPDGSQSEFAGAPLGAGRYTVIRRAN
ncbi:MAG TPA: FG-GAP-like repeat-containing protein [Verrucomicrobiae bacterium]|nr:FG-GAP-like repeat-containing protein [Verrucomicrobiae bacterium]